MTRNLRKPVSGYEDPIQTSWLPNSKLWSSLIFPLRYQNAPDKVLKRDKYIQILPGLNPTALKLAWVLPLTSALTERATFPGQRHGEKLFYNFLYTLALSLVLEISVCFQKAEGINGERIPSCIYPISRLVENKLRLFLLFSRKKYNSLRRNILSTGCGNSH